MVVKDEYTVNEVAEVFRTNPETVRKWIKEGKLEAIKGNSKKEGMRIFESALQSFLSNNPKYTKTAYITAAAALLTGGVSIPASIIISAQKEKSFLANAKIRSSDMIRLLEEEINQEENTLKLINKEKEDLDLKIKSKENRIESIKRLISDLQDDKTNLNSDKNSLVFRNSATPVTIPAKKQRLGQVHKKKTN